MCLQRNGSSASRWTTRSWSTAPATASGNTRASCSRATSSPAMHASPIFRPTAGKFREGLACNRRSAPNHCCPFYSRCFAAAMLCRATLRAACGSGTGRRAKSLGTAPGVTRMLPCRSANYLCLVARMPSDLQQVQGARQGNYRLPVAPA